jgi:hypothetical protein
LWEGYDVNAVESLAEAYHAVLNAPLQRINLVESGHGPSAQDLKEVLVNRVLARDGAKKQ